MINKIKLILAAIIASIIFAGSIHIYNLNEKYIKEKEDKSRYMSNSLAYENYSNSLYTENRVLRLNKDDLKRSNDKLVLTIDSISKLRKSSPNKPGDVSAGVATSVKDTGVVIISNPKQFELDTTVKYNEFTKSTIKIKKDSLISTIDINNIMILNVYTERVYVNQYKNKWNRFWNFDWKKEDVLQYSIHNTNDLIHVKDMRVIKHE